MYFERESIIQYIYNIITYLVWLGAIDLCFDKRFSRRVTTTAEVLGVIPFLYLCVCLPYHSTLRTLLAPAFVLLEVFILFKAEWYKKILAYLLTALCQLAGELLIPGTLMTADEVAAGVYTLPADRQILIFVFSFLVFIVFIICFSVAWKSFQKKLFMSIPAKTWAVWLLFPASQFFIFIRWVVAEGVNQFDVFSLLLGIGICVIANVALLLNISRTSELAEVRAQKNVMEEQLSSQKAHYSALTSQYRQIKKMRHDINNHIFTMQSLLENGKTEEAEKYLSAVNAEMKNSKDQIHCDNVAVNAFLNGRYQLMKESGIKLECSASVPENLSIPDIDLITALGNLLDNAQEACAEADTEEKTIGMEIGVKEAYLLINVSNPVPSQKTNKRRIPYLERGLGSQILKNLAGRYDGHYSTETKNGTFYASLILKV